VTTPAGTVAAADNGGGGPAWAALPSPLDSVDDLRSAARWMLAAVGGVGAVLISGGTLVAVGQVHGTAHVILAGVALLVALVGVGLAIWQTSQVLISPLTTPATVLDAKDRSMGKLRTLLNANPADYFGLVAESVQDLLRRQTLAVRLARQFAQLGQGDPRRAPFEAALRQVEADAARSAPYVRWVVATAHVWQIQERLRQARLYTFIGGVLVVVGAVFFFSVTGGGPTYVPVLTPQPTASPTVTPTATR
jgi:hypothetical protein